MEKNVLITDPEKMEIAKELDKNPELLELFQAARTLTPEDLETVVQFTQERRREA